MDEQTPFRCFTLTLILYLKKANGLLNIEKHGSIFTIRDGFSKIEHIYYSERKNTLK